MKRIVLLEGDTTHRIILKDVLSEGYEVVALTVKEMSRPDLESEVLRYQPDVVIIDTNSVWVRRQRIESTKNALAFGKALRDLSPLVKIIITSNWPKDFHAVVGWQESGDIYFEKPYFIEDLLQEIS